MKCDWLMKHDWLVKSCWTTKCHWLMKYHWYSYSQWLMKYCWSIFEHNSILSCNHLSSYPPTPWRFPQLWNSPISRDRMTHSIREHRRRESRPFFKLEELAQCLVNFASQFHDYKPKLWCPANFWIWPNINKYLQKGKNWDICNFL
jgi:hypothetical protein